MKKNILLFIACVLCSSAIFSQEIKNIYWKNSSENEGCDAVVIAEVSGGDKNQTVTIDIYPAGKNQSSCAPYASFEVPVAEGKARAAWKFQRGTLDIASKKNPKFIAIARYGLHSAQTKTPLEVKLNRLTVKNLKWLDENKKTAKKNVMGKPMLCSADVDGIADKVVVRIRDVNNGKSLVMAEVPVKDNKICLEIVYQWDGFYLEKKPSCVFEIQAPGCSPATSPAIEVSMTFERQIVYFDGTPLDDLPYKVTLMDGKIIKGKTDKNGMIIIEGLIPGEVYVETMEIEDYGIISVS
ncbi:hypothetical protein [Treponema sp.]|uniref:hypothetical protein n=1 Tax=Treponema sp. TaxID=166 RepID=UPI00298EB287|nr:hypothetical protein [Treponema sp.]MCQ2239999.1 hypothetical protein [Treponema sp.]